MTQELKICEAIINMFHLIPAASDKMIEPLTALTLKGEKALLIGQCRHLSSPGCMDASSLFSAITAAAIGLSFSQVTWGMAADGVVLMSRGRRVGDG